MEITKECTVCGNDYIANSNKAKYCSNACRVSAHRKREKHKIKHEDKLQQKLERQELKNLKNRFVELETSFNSFQVEVYKTVSSIYDVVVYKDVNNRELSSMQKSIKELSKSIEMLQTENKNLQKGIRKVQSVNKGLIHEIGFLKEDLEREKSIKKANSPNESSLSMFAKTVENLSSNDKLMEKIAG